MFDIDEIIYLDTAKNEAQHSGSSETDSPSSKRAGDLDVDDNNMRQFTFKKKEDQDAPTDVKSLKFRKNLMFDRIKSTPGAINTKAKF